MIQKKVCVIGATGVGKTSLIKQFVDGIFSEKYLTSIGVKIDKKLLVENNERVQLLIWDMEGIDRYCGFNPRYLRGAKAYYIVVDQTRHQSLYEGIEIFELAKKTNPSALAILVINKVDIPLHEHWNSAELEPHIQDFSKVFYTSAKTGEAVDDMFRFAAFIGE